uniref:Uncharacterized protein n=1 Tax=Hubei levi-like virus 8 TaxID=1922920 RepID=A0A1L3KIQ6_9VIRU|nr:hypothetical protein [Hubei levi-like virus 8]
MEQGGLTTPTASPVQESIPDSDLVKFREELAMRVTAVAPANGDTSSVKMGEYVITDYRANTTNGVYPERPTGGGKTTVSKVPRALETVRTSRQSRVTPNFHRLVKAGAILPVNPFFNSTTVQKHNYRTYSYKLITNGFENYTQTIVGPFSGTSDVYGNFTQPTAQQMTQLDREATLKIRLALKNQQVNMAQIVAERDKTAKSIAKIVKTLADMVMALRKGDLAGAASAVGVHVGFRKKKQYQRAVRRGDLTEAVANAWLELQYAIKPLLMDVDGLVKALADYNYPKATGTATATATLRVNNTTWSGNTAITETGTVSVRYVVYFQVDYPSMPNLASWGLTNPAALAWELIPFSFVFDWLIPIGDWLSALDATVGMSFSDGSKSVKRDLTRVSNTRSKRVIAEYPYTWGRASEVSETHDTSSFKETSVQRTKLLSFPAVKMPPYKNPASLVHLASSMALLRKAISIDTLREIIPDGRRR